MSNKSLGTLTLDLIAKIGGFTAPIDQAARKSKKAAKEIEDSGKQAGATWKSLAGIVGGAIAGISVGAIFSRMITETKNASAEQAQLAAVLKSTGQAAGYSQTQLNGMADAMEDVTAISAGDITNAQIALLAFTGIVGEQLPRALQAAADMSARTGTDITSAAETIGRALDVPSKGMAALSKQGFRFTDSQKEVIKQLEATGRTAEAQGIILDALEETYGGAAKAARDTLGGAYESLQNTIDGLLTDEKGFPALKNAIEETNKTLQDESVKSGIDSLTGGIGEISQGAINAASELGSLGKQIATTMASLTGNLLPEDELKTEIEGINRALKGGLSTPLGYLFTSEEELKTLLAEKQAALELLTGIEKTEKAVQDLNNSGSSGKGKTPFVEYNNEGINYGIDDDIDSRIKGQRDLTAAYEAQVVALERANELSADAGELQKVRYEITSGSLKGVNAEQAKRLEQLAWERDLQIWIKDEEKKLFDQREKLEGNLKSVREDLRTDEENYQAAAVERLAVLNDALEAGIVSETEYGQLIIANTDKLGEQIDKLKDKTTEMDEFTKTAARSIQGELSNALVEGFEGGGDDILKRWGDLIKRLIADAVAADLTRALFGQGSLGSAGGGQFGTADIITGLGGLFAGFFDSGGNIPAGRYGLVGEIGPEIVAGPAVVTGRLETEKQLNGGGGVGNITMNFPGVTNAQEARKAAGAAGRELLAIISGAQRYT